jgi:hypothetical protein
MQILHRDVAPDNIIIQENGDAVLLDFGSARQIIGDMTKGLTVILKPGYAPVEQYAGDASLEQGPFTDIYALAAVMYFAIVRQAPPSSIARMIKDPITPLAIQAPEGYSPSFLAAIDKGLAVLAQDRPQTIDAFRELLGIVSLGPPPPTRANGASQRGLPQARVEEPPAGIRMPVAEEVPAAAAPPAARRRWPFITGVSAVLAVAAMGLYALVHSAADDTIMVAQQHAAAPAPASASARGLDPTESVVEVAPPLASAPAPAPEAPLEDIKPAAAPMVVVETASYNLAIKPWGTVYVDGRERGVTPPMKKLVLPVGKHKIRIVNPSFPEYSINLSATKNRPGTIEHDFASAKK